MIETLICKVTYISRLTQSFSNEMSKDTQKKQSVICKANYTRRNYSISIAKVIHEEKYPHLTEDDLSTLQLKQTAFTE